MRSPAFRIIGAVVCAMLLIVVTFMSLLAIPPASTVTSSNVLDYLYSISGTKTISGQHNREPNSNPVSWTNWIYTVTGLYPGLWGGDFLFRQDDILHRSALITAAKEQWDKGSLVTLMWHVCPPTMEEPCEFENGITSTLSVSQWNDLVTDTGTLNQKWKERVDEIVPYLQYLKDNKVEVLWRPLHEMNDDWCWWCGRPGLTGSLKLYQITHDYMSITKGLTNLIWVWTLKDVTPALTTTLLATASAYYPGDQYVDVVALDPWNNWDFPIKNYEAMMTIAKGKPMAIGETPRLPTTNVLETQPRWVWFLGWAEWIGNENSEEEIRAFYNNPRVVNQGCMILEGLGKTCIWLPLVMK